MSARSHLPFILLVCVAQVFAEAPASIVLAGADLHTVSHGVIERGEVLVRDGRIEAIGKHVQAPSGSRRVDLVGKRIYPGLIAAQSVLGLSEVSAVRATNDFAEAGMISPEVSAVSAVNPDTELWPVARANGVLTALVVPRAGTDGVITGRSALMQPYGWTAEQMTVVSPAAMHLHWPSARIPDWMPASARERAADGARAKRIALERAMRDVRAYAAAKSADPALADDLRWEAIRPVLAGAVPLFVHAETAVAIREALDFAERENIRIVLVGGGDAWRFAATLRERGIAVVLGSAHNVPIRRWEGYDTVFASAGKLAAAGVKLVIANDGDAMAASNERNLPYQAASYVAFGLGTDAALRAITLTPAEVLGVADRLGSLDIGKEATLFVTDGDVFDARTHVERVWIRGREVELSDRQTRLQEKYERKYRGEARD